MRSKNPALVAIIAGIITFVFGAAANVALAESFCPEGGERFTGSEKFCPSHGAALQPVAKAKSSALSGNGTVKSEAAKQKQAAEWYKQAKNYYAGDGVEIDQAKAMSLHKKAANAGNPVAQVSLGFIYEIGDEGFEINFTEALKWYRMAAAQGDPVGRYSLGNMYQAGKGVEQDYAKAARLFSEAAEEESRGRHLAQQQLGDLYLEGKGVGKDLEKAEAYWLAAVGTGYAFSQALLGLRYEHGAFGRVDLDMARKYYRLAAAQGFKEADASLTRLNAKLAEEEAIKQISLESIEKIAGGYSVEEVYAKRKTLAGRTVRVRGRVVKFVKEIMNTNWLHLQDGSGSGGAGTNDLTVTTQAEVKSGDLVVVEGIIVCDKDFGYGYLYEVIMDDAAVKIESAR